MIKKKLGNQRGENLLIEKEKMWGNRTDLVHGFGEAVEIIDGFVPGDDVDGGFSGLPMSGDDENGSGSLLHNRLLP